MRLGPLSVAASAALQAFTQIAQWEREVSALSGTEWGEVLMGETHAEIAVDLAREAMEGGQTHLSEAMAHALRYRLGAATVSAGNLLQCETIPSAFREELAILRQHPVLRECEVLAPAAGCGRARLAERLLDHGQLPPLITAAPEGRRAPPIR